MITIRLQSNNNVIFEVDYETAIISKWVKAELDVLLREELNTTIIPVDVNSDILTIVFQWMGHYKEFYKQNDYILNDILLERFNCYDVWDDEFFRFDMSTLRLLKATANNLDIKGLAKQIRYRISALTTSANFCSPQHRLIKLKLAKPSSGSDGSPKSSETRKRVATNFIQSIDNTKRAKLEYNHFIQI